MRRGDKIMINRLVILASGAALVLGGCNKHDENNVAASDNAAMSDNMMVANDAAVSPLTAQGFANAAAASDRFEIESSQLAATNGSSAEVKKFATQMIAAHTASTAKLKSTLATQSPAITPDDTLGAEQQSTLDSLKGQTGAAFDSAYAAAQVDGHTKALDALKNYSASGDNDALKGFADGLIPTVTSHLNLAKGLK
jgi:putative membrane protein